MTDFRTIEIDFDVHKLIETSRKSFAESPNTVLRRLLKLPSVPVDESQEKKINSAGRPWSGEGVMLPHGTVLRMRYNRRQYEGQISDGNWVINGKVFDSPSGAASGVALTKSGKTTRLDGWMYWEVKVPGDSSWTSIRALRSKHNRAPGVTLESLGL